MNKKQVAEELVTLAREMTADAGWIKKSIARFIDKNSEAIEQDEYEFARIKIEGPVESTKWMNISIENLERIVKAVR